MARRDRYNSEEVEADKKIKITKENWKEALLVFAFLKPYRLQFIGGLIIIALSSLTTLALPYFLKELIDSANDIKEGRQATHPSYIALGMMAILVVQMILSFSRVYLFTLVGENALKDLRSEVYKKMIRLPMDFFAQRRVGELSSRLTSDLSQIQDAVTFMLAEILRGILTMLVGIGLIFFISKMLTLIMMSVIPVIVIIAVFFGKHIRKLSRKAQDQLADSNTIVQETLSGIANVKAFSNEWFETNRYIRSLKMVVDLAIQNGKTRGYFISFMLFSLFGAIILVVWFGVGMMQKGTLSFGALTAFVVYTAFVGGSMAGFADLYSNLQKTLGATQRVRELLKEETEQVSTTEEAIKKEYVFNGEVEFREVAFSYPSRPEIQVLKSVSIKAKAGQQVALVGPSGAGKSTIASLLLRFYEPDKGQIFFDGRNAADIPISQVRMQMAVVPQDVMLFGGTIRENIAYGNPDASTEEIIAAAEKAYADDFINSFPEKYETVVGERGIKLSGGQRQRIAIARAILKDPAILILDEATSSLDSASEHQVQLALENLMKNRTTFVIAHRLSTIRNADQIVVLDKGFVRESGSHESLMAMDDGMYKTLSRFQLELS